MGNSKTTTAQQVRTCLRFWSPEAEQGPSTDRGGRTQSLGHNLRARVYSATSTTDENMKACTLLHCSLSGLGYLFVNWAGRFYVYVNVFHAEKLVESFT